MQAPPLDGARNSYSAAGGEGLKFGVVKNHVEVQSGDERGRQVARLRKRLVLGTGELLRNRNSALRGMCRVADAGMRWEFREDAKLGTQDAYAP
ncbi:MAG TPA: hypothetical protein DCP71_03885 [Verrucomicrobiales bacterium]|nr:hypothetical protein [Verrucomicrobiales bacterium]